MEFSDAQNEFDEVKQEITRKLDEYGVKWSEWGVGTAKTLEHLIKEVIDGETLLKENPERGLIRKVSIVYIDIFFITPDGKCLKLVEEKQVFKDGRERRRNLEGSIAEKLRATEKADVALTSRAIQEELGIETFVPVFYKGLREVIEDSPSYPGLTMQATNYYFEAYLNETQYQPAGYVERQTDKDTYFVWKEI